MPTAVIAIVRFDSGRSIGSEVDEPRCAVDPRRPVLEKVWVSTQRIAFIEYRIDPTLAEAHAGARTCWGDIGGAVIQVHSTPQLMARDRFPMGAAVAPNRALRVNNRTELLNQVVANAVSNLDIGSDVERP